MGNSIYWGKYRALLPRQLALYVPTDWHFEVEDLRDQPVDALLHIKSPDGRSGTVALEFQAALTPSTARRALAQLARSSADDTLLVAPYISPQTQRFLREQSASYLDFAGNVHWRLHSPAMFISATSNAPSPEKRPTGRTLSGAKAGRLIRYLCDELPPFTVTRLARELDMDYGNVSRYLNLLERDALITRTSRGPVTEIDWEGVLRRWSEDYRPPSMERYLDPRGTGRFVRLLASSDVRYAVSGLAAATVYVPYTASQSIFCYCDNPVEIAEKLELREGKRHGNILLARPFDDVVYTNARKIDETMVVAPTQALVDLLVSHGRELQQAEELIEWMKGHENEWRG